MLMRARPIPDIALDKHVAFLGATGSGKTSAAKSGIVEPALEAGERVLMIDPTGAWWGLRVGANGKSKGYPIYIFGGDHGDYPLRARDAAVLAEAFGTSSDSAIFDTSLMTVSERTAFFTEFSEVIRRKNKGPLKLIIDEAHLFMPQVGAKAGGGVPAMLHAGNNLVSLGRSKGLRITLISQRPAKLHKDSLTQVQSMVAMRLMAPQDRKAVSEWIADQADAEKGKEIVASLPSLKPGEAWVWAPEAGVLNRVTFPLPKTFDSSRAPDAHDGAGPQLAPINLDALKGRLGTVEAETKANDPKTLKAEVARLTRELAANPVAGIPTADPKAVDDAYQNGLAEGLARGENRAKAALAAVESRLKDALAVAAASIESLASPMPTPLVRSRPAVAATPRPVRTPAPTAANGEGNVSGVQQVILNSVAEMEALCGKPPPRTLVAMMANYKNVKSTGFAKALSNLSATGLVSYPDSGTVSLTPDGLNVAAPPSAALTTADVQSRVIEIMGDTAGRILTNLIEAYPGDLDREVLAQNSGYQNVKSTGFAKALSRLSALGFVKYPSSRLARAGEILFP